MFLRMNLLQWLAMQLLRFLKARRWVLQLELAKAHLLQLMANGRQQRQSKP